MGSFLCIDKLPLYSKFEQFFSRPVEIIQVCHPMSFLITPSVISLEAGASDAAPSISRHREQRWAQREGAIDLESL